MPLKLEIGFAEKESRLLVDGTPVSCPYTPEDSGFHIVTVSYNGATLPEKTTIKNFPDRPGGRVGMHILRRGVLGINLPHNDVIKENPGRIAEGSTQIIFWAIEPTEEQFQTGQNPAGEDLPERLTPVTDQK